MYIKEIRNKVGLTSSLVAQVLGIDLKVYMMIENNEIGLNFKLIENLCLIFGCSEKDLINNSNENYYNLSHVNYKELCDIVRFRKIYAKNF